MGITSEETKDQEIGEKDDKVDETENGEIVEKKSTDCEENGDTEMECEDGNDDEG